MSLLASLLHEAGLIPTDLYLRSTLEGQRAQLEREIRVWLADPEAGGVPLRLTEALATLDRQLAALRGCE